MDFKCQACGFRIFNRRYPKCESCGVELSPGLALSDAERKAAYEADQAALDASWRAERKATAGSTPPTDGGTALLAGLLAATSTGDT